MDREIYHFGIILSDIIKRGVTTLKLIITAKGFELTEGIKNAVHHQFQRIEKFIDDNHPVQVLLKIEHQTQIAEATITFNSKTFKVTASANDLYLAIGDLVTESKEKISRELSKWHEKIATTIKGFQEVFDSQEQDNEEDDELSSLIVKRKHFDMKPMNETEALLQMQALNHHSFMFFNAETSRMCLLYKRNDHSYGLIEATIE